MPENSFVSVVQEAFKFCGGVVPEYSFEIVSGKAITEAYATNELGQSCMVGRPQAETYANSPDCQLLIVSHKGTPLGRALLWKTVEGPTVLDRLYPSNVTKHVDAVRNLSLIHISEPTRPCGTSRMPSSA